MLHTMQPPQCNMGRHPKAEKREVPKYNTRCNRIAEKQLLPNISLIVCSYLVAPGT